MNLLAFDTSTDTLSVAVQSRGGVPLQHVAAGGAQASLTLIAAVQDLLGRARLRLGDLDAIAFGRGPGSFTGLRTACSVAQGLAFGAGVPVLPVDTLMAVAEEARELEGATRIVAVLDARMDEVYSAAYVHDGGRWRQQGDFSLGRPESVAVPEGWVVAGNAFSAYAGRLAPDARRLHALPMAAALLRMAPALIAAGGPVSAERALPLYIRDKVAQTTEERAALRAAPPQRP
ncbi:MAG: tRNA (adenosine(37)-N6)-threonylcarbamoyltransferase complex dimerization subunit type 1 TsaB [Ramlibacter sp.]